jgi:hypothetical protein
MHGFAAAKGFAVGERDVRRRRRGSGRGNSRAIRLSNVAAEARFDLASGRPIALSRRQLKRFASIARAKRM